MAGSLTRIDRQGLRPVARDLCSRAEILRFFDGFELADPGFVYVPRWRPDSPADVPGDPSRSSAS